MKMHTEISMMLRRAAALPVILAICAGCTTAPPAIDTSPDAEVTFDGLTEVLNTQADKAWAVPGLDLSGYSKIKLQGAGIEYRPGGNSGRSYVSRSRGGPFEVTERQKERMLEIVSEEFLGELRKSEKFTIVDESGPDVLLVRGALLDVVSFVPDDTGASNVDIYLSSVGEATLVLEIRDSISEAILVRAIDRRAAEDMSGMFEANRVTNATEIRRLVRRWGRALTESLDTFGAAGT
jgi:hypothetical protein